MSASEAFQVHWSGAAVGDLESIVGHIAEDDRQAAMGVLDRLEHRASTLVRARAGITSEIVGAETPGGQGETMERTLRTRLRNNAAGKPKADRPPGWIGVQKPEVIPARALNMPERGRIVPELREQGITVYRELVEPPWRILYRIESDRVWVLAVIDGRRNVEDILLKRLTPE